MRDGGAMGESSVAPLPRARVSGLLIQRTASRHIPLPSRAARSAEEMAERRLFLRPECKFRGLQPYMDGEESRDAGWRRAGLMAAAQRGDADAYGELLNEIGPVLMRFLRARVRDAQDAEDLYQETLHGHPSRATRLRCRTGRSSRGCSPLPGTSSPRTPSGTACARRARCWSPPRPSGRRRATATCSRARAGASPP